MIRPFNQVLRIGWDFEQGLIPWDAAATALRALGISPLSLLGWVEALPDYLPLSPSMRAVVAESYPQTGTRMEGALAAAPDLFLTDPGERVLLLRLTLAGWAGRHLPEWLARIEVERLGLEDCPGITELHLSGMPREVHVARMPNLRAMAEEGAAEVWDLCIQDCPELQSLPDIVVADGRLTLVNCPSVTRVARTEPLMSLHLRNLPRLRELDLPAVGQLEVRNLPELRSVGDLHVREYFSLNDCPSLENLPTLAADPHFAPWGLAVDCTSLGPGAGVGGVEFITTAQLIEAAEQISWRPPGLASPNLSLWCPEVEPQGRFLMGLLDDPWALVHALLEEGVPADAAMLRALRQAPDVGQAVRWAQRFHGEPKLRPLLWRALESLGIHPASIDPGRFFDPHPGTLVLLDEPSLFDVFLDQRDDLVEIPMPVLALGRLGIEVHPRLRRLPYRLEVKGDLRLYSCPLLTRMPGILRVGGDLWLHDLPRLSAWGPETQLGGGLVLDEVPRLSAPPGFLGTPQTFVDFLV